MSDNGWNSAVKTSPAANYKLPTVIDVGVTLKFVENKQTTKSHYAFSDAPTAKTTNTEGTTLPDVTVKSSAKLKKLDGSIIPNPASANIAEAAKASADKLLNMKLFDKANIGMAMQPKSKKSGGRGNKQYILDGEIVNQKTFEDFFQSLKEERELIKSPLVLVNLNNKYDISIQVKGGGVTAQLEAIQLAISKALCLIDANYRPQLHEKLFLRRDSRIKESRKYGLKKARKAPQYSKR